MSCARTRTGVGDRAAVAVLLGRFVGVRLGAAVQVGVFVGDGDIVGVSVRVAVEEGTKRATLSGGVSDGCSAACSSMNRNEKSKAEASRIPSAPMKDSQATRWRKEK